MLLIDRAWKANVNVKKKKKDTSFSGHDLIEVEFSKIF